MDSSRRIRLGVLVPSSNTAMEPIINDILGYINSQKVLYITAHFSRFRVTQISLDQSAESQFDLEKMVHAASLLADAGVEAIAWGGTSAGWLGIDSDRALCTAIEERFHIPATTSTLAMIELVHMMSGPKLGLVTPYVPGMNYAIQRNFAAEGVHFADGRYLSIMDNRAIANVTNSTLDQLIYDVLAPNPDLNAIAVFCTNLSAAGRVIQWEREYATKDLVILDSVATTIWGLLRKVNLNIPNLRIDQEAGKIFTFPKKDEQT